MEWMRDRITLFHYEEKHELDLGLIVVIVNKNEDGKYYFWLQGVVQRKSKLTYTTADEAKDNAIILIRHKLGNMLAKLNSMEAPPVQRPAER